MPGPGFSHKGRVNRHLKKVAIRKAETPMVPANREKGRPARWAGASGSSVPVLAGPDELVAIFAFHL
jgi:hypothetical protein